MMQLKDCYLLDILSQRVYRMFYLYCKTDQNRQRLGSAAVYICKFHLASYTLHFFKKKLQSPGTYVAERIWNPS